MTHLDQKNALLTITNLTKSYDKQPIFRNFNFLIKKGEFVCLCGPNGVGKTTLLNLIAGLADAQQGSIRFLKSKGTKPKVGFIFQNYQESLFPWLTARENIAFPLRINGYSEQHISKSISWATKIVKINFSLKQHPYQLSGGQQQLISLMRGLVFKPDIFLLDEPFSSLDYQTTLAFLNILMGIWLKTKITVLFVSHDIDSALFLSQRLVLLKGRPVKIIKSFTNTSPYPRNLKFLSTKKVADMKREIIYSLFSKEVK